MEIWTPRVDPAFVASVARTVAEVVAPPPRRSIATTSTLARS